MLYFDMTMVVKLKSSAKAIRFFCVKNADFPRISFFDGGKCARSQTLRHEMDWNCCEILYSHLIFITGTKKAIFKVKYEIVLRTPYSKARCPPFPWEKALSKKFTVYQLGFNWTMKGTIKPKRLIRYCCMPKLFKPWTCANRAKYWWSLKTL